MPLVGDHEVEIKATGNNVPFKSFLNRYPTPYEQSESTNQLYYSWNYGGKAMLPSEVESVCNLKCSFKTPPQ